MTDDARPGDRRNLLTRPSYLPEDGDTPARFRRRVRQDRRRPYFQRYGDQSDALAPIAAKNHKNGVDNPYAQMRKDLGFDFCRAGEREEPLSSPAR